VNASPTTTLEGHLERVTYYNPDSHYLIARLRTSDHQSLVSVLGTMPDPNLGEILKICGTWQTHPRYGQQFRFESFEVVLPATVDGIRKYLESGFIKGIGPKAVARIVGHFKDHTLSVIEDHPEALTLVKGIGRKTAQRIAEAWKSHHAVRRLIQLLQQNGIKTAYCAKLLKQYGTQAADILAHEPYRVATDIPRIGFAIADAIVQNSGMAVDPHQRARACMGYLLQQTSEDGHVFVYQQDLIDRGQSVFGIDPDIGRAALDHLAAAGDVVREGLAETGSGPAVYPALLYEAETTIARRLLAALTIAAPESDLGPERLTETLLKRLAIKLSEEQLQVPQGALTRRLAIITGGPGTGKTTLIRALTAIFDAQGKQVLLAAPTGRAARRISEVTSRPAATIHKLLGCNLTDGHFERDQDNPLQADAVIIDEASMVDTLLFCHLLKATPLSATLILVGDVFQLPSVGPGNVLSDLIQSGRIETYELTEIFRQAQESPIVMNAHRVRRGEMPDLDRQPGGEALLEFYFIEQGHPEAVLKTIVDLCAERIPHRFGLHRTEEIQVLTPMHKGVVGTLNLNRVLQQRLNPDAPGIDAVGCTFKIGDKVMHLRNNYQKDVFNGEIGSISEFDSAAQTVQVDYDGRRVTYDFTELEELTLAYAISVHKSQGSEYPAVIVPVMTQHFALLQRNLLYTALTRGQKLVVLIGTRKALSLALGNDSPCRRMSALAWRLRGMMQEGHDGL
jgi:exodeoxyribonuclease V alpha subunit